MALWPNRIVNHGLADPRELLANPKNWRAHPQHQAQVLSSVINSIGLVDEVIVNTTTGHIVNGHLRVTLAIQEGQDQVPVKYVELSQEEEDRILATFDRIPMLAEEDRVRLRDLQQDPRVKELLSSSTLPITSSPTSQARGNGEPLANWEVEMGQVWAIGPHRLMCGDSSNPDHLDALFQGDQAGMVFTDPPYNLGSGIGPVAASDIRDAYQDLSESDWDKDFNFQPELWPMAEDISVYVCASQFTAGPVWEWMSSWADFYSYVVWTKPNPMPSMTKRHWTFGTELLCYATRGNHVFNFPLQGHALGYWPIMVPPHETEHPTEKPVELVVKAMSASSRPGDLVADFYAGTGSTVVAAQQLGRKCYAMEIDTCFVDQALTRLGRLGMEPQLMS